VEVGGRTGLTAFVTATLFILALFFSPIVAIVPSCATAPALVLVGVFMMMSLKDLDYGNWTELVPACIAIMVMPFSYSIAVGIEFGIISYVAIKILSGKMKDVSAIMIGLAVLFIAKELFF